MLVTVKVYHYEVFGKGLIELDIDDDATVGDVLNELCRKFGVKVEAMLSIPLNIFLNETYLNLSSDLHRKVKDGDRITIFRPVGGG